MNINLFSSNSSYNAVSKYTFTFQSEPNLPPIFFMRVVLPDCFIANINTIMA
jgi:hypothetical protein